MYINICIYPPSLSDYLSFPYLYLSLSKYMSVYLSIYCVNSLLLGCTLLMKIIDFLGLLIDTERTDGHVNTLMHSA